MSGKSDADRLLEVLELIARRIDELDTRLMKVVEAIGDSGSLIHSVLDDFEH